MWSPLEWGALFLRVWTEQKQTNVTTAHIGVKFTILEEGV